MGFQFIGYDTKIDFVGKRYLAYAATILIIAIGLLWTVVQGGPKLGIDFAGGVVVQVHFDKPVSDEDLKKSMEALNLPGFVTQRFGEGGRDYLLRFSSPDIDATKLRADVTKNLAEAFPDNPASIQRLEVVGPKVGADLTNKALEALYYATLLIAVYISGRFEQRWMAGGIMAAVLWGGLYALSFTNLGMGWLVLIALTITLTVCWRMKLNFALGAVVGLLHDVVFTFGIINMLGVEIDLNVVAALLTLAGYSLNDTVIVYDRIRENLRSGKYASLEDLINTSVNQTLSRTILTSGTTFVATLALYIMGGGVIHDFALTMLIGVAVGTFSSIYPSATMLLALGDTAHYVREEEVYERPGEHGVV